VSIVLLFAISMLLIGLLKRRALYKNREAHKAGNDGMNRSTVVQADIDPLYAYPQNTGELSENNYMEQILSAQAEIYALQSQINPHFLYNTLETIRSHAVDEKQLEIAEMTEALSRIFRYSISRPGEITTFTEEIYNVDRYMLIQQYRFRGRFKLIKQFDEDKEDFMQYKMPILTIQPIVENAIYHGLEPKKGQGTVIIRAYITQSRFVINISDDGTGMDAQTLEKLQNAMMLGIEAVPVKKKDKNSMGIALVNVNQRIKWLFGKQYGLDVTSTQGVGTMVEITLPKVEHDVQKIL
jgi:two-component system sensor histidine kinase YesM